MKSVSISSRNSPCSTRPGTWDKRAGKRRHVLDEAECRVEDEVALVRVERRAVGTVSPASAMPPSSRRARVTHAAGEGQHLDWERKRAEARHRLARVDDDADASRGGGDHLLAEQRTAAALDRAQGRIDLVGAIDREVDARDGVEGPHRQTDAIGRALPSRSRWRRIPRAGPGPRRRPTALTA